MRTSIQIILFFLFLVFAGAAILFFNVWVFAKNPQNIKNLASETNSYETFAFFVKEKIVRENNISLDGNGLLETLSEGITTSETQNILESGIDQFYKGTSSESASKQLTIVIPAPDHPLPGNINFRRTFDLAAIPLYNSFRFIPIALTVVALVPLFFWGLLVALAKSAAQRVQLVGVTLLALSADLLIILSVLYFLTPKLVTGLIASFGAFDDAKLTNILNKILTSAIAHQRTYLIYEIFILLFISFGFIFIGRFARKEKTDLTNFDRMSA